MKLHLSGPQLKPIRKAVVDAYIGAGAGALDALNLALTDFLEDKTVYNYVNVQAPFELQVGQLLAQANGQGWLPSLLGAVLTDRPECEDFAALIRPVLRTVPAGQALAVAAAATTPEALRAELQQLLPGSTIVSPETMRRRMRAVCRIDYADQSPPGAGTGFLVGPDLVLTNWHVMTRVIEAPNAASQLRFRFDLWTSAKAADGDGRVASAAGVAAVQRFRPAGGVELPGGVGEPSMEQLDYALVQLSEAVGNDTLTDDNGRRAYIRLRRAAPEPVAGSVLMVLQHPLRGELQFAMGAVVGRNEAGSRLKHSAATQDGSSGSPVLDAELSLVALHNGARRGTPRSGESCNTAVPITRIADDLAAAGLGNVLHE